MFLLLLIPFNTLELYMYFQLASWRDQKLQQGFIDIRWSQTYDYGYVPNPSLQNVFMAAAFDLPDFNSPYGGYVFFIHYLYTRIILATPFESS